MGFDLSGLKPQENTKKPEILIKHPSGWQIEDEATQREWYIAYEKWEKKTQVYTLETMFGIGDHYGYLFVVLVKIY